MLSTSSEQRWLALKTTRRLGKSDTLNFASCGRDARVAGTRTVHTRRGHTNVRVVLVQCLEPTRTITVTYTESANVPSLVVSTARTQRDPPFRPRASPVWSTVATSVSLDDHRTWPGHGTGRFLRTQCDMAVRPECVELVYDGMNTSISGLRRYAGLLTVAAGAACGNRQDLVLPADVPVSISISPGPNIVINVGTWTPLAVVEKNGAGDVVAIASPGAVAFVSRKPSVATVDTTGRLAAIGVGSTYVVANFLAATGRLVDSVGVIVLSGTP